MVHRLDAKVTRYVTRLKEKVAIITGGGTGIGKAIALAFAREGANLAVLGCRREPLEEVAREVTALGGKCLPIVCDVTQNAAVTGGADEAERALGQINVLVNNAGALSVSTVESISEDDWDRVIETNLKGPFLFSRAVLPDSVEPKAEPSSTSAPSWDSSP
jgi:NAD(P)-dependent dehydrogenase (short-subunit alcohol dehydrogenase family)